MPWTKDQKQIGVRACKAAGISDAQRRDLLLRNIDNAHSPGGQITSTAPRLNNHDFEAFMAMVENFAGGQVLHFTRGYWGKCAADHHGRMRFKVAQLARQLEAQGLLQPGGVGLAGWIEKRVAKGATDRIEQLDYQQLRALIIGLEAYARQNAMPIAS